MILPKLARRALRILAGQTLAVFIVISIGCGNSESENAQPTAVFKVSDEQRNAPAIVTFDGTGSSDSDGTIVSYDWTFGDDSSASGAVVEHEFASEGIYSVTLTVVDDGGSSASLTELVTVLPPENVPPVATIAVDQRRGVAPLTAQLSAAKSKDVDGEVVSYLWQFSDGTTSSELAVERTYTEPGDYVVHLTVTDNDGAQAEDSMTLTALAEDAKFSISGTITALPYTDVDGDVNDPFADYLDNNGHGFSAFQAIGNPVLLNGFVSDRQTSSVGDRFAFDVDLHDIYSVELNKGDYVSLHVIDIDFADVDLYLLDAATGDIIAFSEGNNEFESVQAPATKKYLVMVFAENYFSKYVLRIGESSMVAGPRASGKSADFEPDQAIVKFRARSGHVSAQSVTNNMQLELNHPGKSRAALAKINRLNPQTRAAFNLQASRFDWLARKNPAAVAKIETIRALSQIAAQADVEYAEPNYRVQLSHIPSDPSYASQWHYPAINLPEAWDLTRGDPNVVVAVIDSGIYAAHQDLQGQVLPGYDFVSSASYDTDGEGPDGATSGIDDNPDDPGDGVFVAQSSWHGTHVTGTLVALMDNAEGGTGVAPGARVMPLRALGRGGGLAYDILQSVRYAAGMENDSGTLPLRPADIINLSLGGSGYSQVSQNLYTQVRAKGIFVVAAAGNEDTDEPMYPASYDGVVSVAATDTNGNRAGYSNRGAFIDIAAPGGIRGVDANNDGAPDGIYSTFVQATSTSKRGSYISYQGTSMAAPHVSGVIALMKSVHPGLTPEEFDSLLISGAITSDRGDPGRDNEYGYGLLDAQLAVNAALSLAGGASTAAVYADRNILAFDDAVQLQTVELRAIGGDSISVVGVSTDSEWLMVEARNVGANGIGTYDVSVDSAGLEDGTYKGFVRFESDRESEVAIQVNLRVGEFIPTGNAGYLYVLLIDALTGNIDVRGVAANEGSYMYSFTDVPVGEYYVAAGSDVDNDSYVCDPGETCGYYPSLGDFTLIRLDGDRPGTDFSAGLSESIGAQGSKSTKRGFSRIPQ